MTCLSFGKRRHCKHYCGTCLNGPMVSCKYAIICHRTRCKWFTQPIRNRLVRAGVCRQIAVRKQNAKRVGVIRGLSVEDKSFVRGVAHDLVRAERRLEWLK